MCMVPIHPLPPMLNAHLEIAQRHHEAMWAQRLALERERARHRYAGLGMVKMVSTFQGYTILQVLTGDQRFTVQEQQEIDQYLDNLKAFWLRPNGDYWSDTPYRAVRRFYDYRTDQTYETEYDQ